MFTTLKTLAILGTLTGSAILGTQAVSAHEIDTRCPAPVIYHTDNDHRFDRDDHRITRDDHRQLGRHLLQTNDRHFRLDATHR